MKIIALAALALAGAATAGVVAHAGATRTTVVVTEKEFRIGLSTHKPHAGVVRFVVRNRGRYPHSLAIAGPGVKQRRTALIRPGRSAVLTVTLKAGAYSLWCPVPGHAAQGMKATLTVPGAAASTSSGGSGGGYGGGATTGGGGTTTDSGVPWG